MNNKQQTSSGKSNQVVSKSSEYEIISSYRDLRVYKLAFDSAMRIFELSKSWPKEEKYSLTDQIRRASRSVCSNISEAWRKRRYPPHFVSKLSDSDTEAAETEVWLDFAFACGYLAETDHKELRANYDHIGGMLVNMMNNPEKWCRRSEG
jgi:four helix bundle protein